MNISLERIATLNLQGHEWETVGNFRVLRVKSFELQQVRGFLGLYLTTDAGKHLLAEFKPDQLVKLMHGSSIGKRLALDDLFVGVHVV